MPHEQAPQTYFVDSTGSYTREQWMLKQILDELKSINAKLERLLPAAPGGTAGPPAESGKP